MTNYNAQAPGSDDPEPFELLQLLRVGAYTQAWRARVVQPDLAAAYGTSEVFLEIPLNRPGDRFLRSRLEGYEGLFARIKESDTPNLVRYLGFEAFSGKIVMVTEYVPGDTLRRLIGKIPRPGERKEPLPLDKAVRIASGILRGLETLHGAHIVHRTIQPEGILMAGDVPKIFDLAFCQVLDLDEDGGPLLLVPRVADGAGRLVRVGRLVGWRCPVRDGHGPPALQ
jgi:serine/threonine protein kinase